MNETDGLELPATQKNLLQMARQGMLDLRGYERALKIIGFTPNTQKWNRFLDVLLLVLGAGLTVCGIYFFFAYNWAEMHRFVKMGIVGVLLLGLVIATSRLPEEKLPAKITLTVAGVLIGALLAVYGQVYQTGADSYKLFLGWVILMAGWVFVSKFTPMWFIWILLIDTTLILYWDQMVSWRSPQYSAIQLWGFAINGLFVLAWELFSGKTDWLVSRWTPRILSLINFYIVTAAATIFVSEGLDDDPYTLATSVVWLVFLPAMIYVYSQKKLDLFMLTLSAISLMTVFTTWVANQLDQSNFNNDFVPLILGLLIVGQTALVVTLLLRVSKSRKEVEQ
ncbi:MAG: DUF2157 domain-containing protein [Chloroflexi bacterium]|nr:DUF2157 domain-containing protein [Chloroflexota bacterium]